MDLEQEIRQRTITIAFALHHISYLITDENLEKYQAETDVISDNVMWFVNKLKEVANES